MKQTRETLELICQVFNLGTLRAWTTANEIVGDCRAIYFTATGTAEQFTYYEPIKN